MLYNFIAHRPVKFCLLTSFSFFNFDTHSSQHSLTKLPSLPIKSRIKKYVLQSLSLPRLINRLTPNDPYMGRTARLTSKCCILFIFSANINAEYFKYALYSPFFLQNAVSFIMLICLVSVFFTFYVQGLIKSKK